MIFNLLTASLVTLAPMNVDVATLSKQQYSGTVVKLSASELVIDTGQEKKTFTTDQLLRVMLQQPTESRGEGDIWVELVDGSRIRASGYEVANGKVMINAVDGGTIETRTSNIRNVQFRSHDSDPEMRQRWLDILKEPLVGDTIVIRKVIEQTEESKTIELRGVEGVFYDVTAENVRFKFDDTEFDVAREKVEGLRYYHAAGRELPQGICHIHDVSDSRWHARSLDLRDERIEFVTTSGVKYSLPFSHVAGLDFAQGKIVYLSDLTPASVRWRPYFSDVSATGSAWKLNQPRADQSFDGTKIAVNDDTEVVEFEKGLAIRSQTSMLFLLDDEFKRFVATAGIDPSRSNMGNVRLRISGNGKLLYESVIHGELAAEKIDIPIAGVRRLNIVVDYGDDLTIGDYLHLGDAKVSK